MRPSRHLSCCERRLALVAICVAALTHSAAEAAPPHPSKEKTLPAVRWDEQTPGCTFSRTDDGKFRYGLWYGDVGVTVSVDSQELEKVHRRHEPFFSVLIDVRYRGQATLDFDGGMSTLEFVRHFHTVQTSLDPDEFAQKIQADADALDHETAREIEKHPEKKDQKETFERTFQKETTELLDFVSKSTLRPVRLDQGNPEVSGWDLFSISSKWIGGWKKPEVFILRVPIEQKVFEFPFQLPPKPGEVRLRKRE
jgi:hypothetical protein